MLTQYYKNQLIKSVIKLFVGVLLLSNYSCDQGTLENDSLIKSKLKIIDSFDSFNQVINVSEKKLLVMEFYADWCGPCHTLEPILEKIEKNHADQVAVYKILYDKNRKLINRFGVDRIPYVLFIRNNIIVYKLVGLHPEETYFDVIRSYQHKPS